MRAHACCLQADVASWPGRTAQLLDVVLVPLARRLCSAHARQVLREPAARGQRVLGERVAVRAARICDAHLLRGDQVVKEQVVEARGRGVEPLEAGQLGPHCLKGSSAAQLLLQESSAY
jgi:hypothetical protein